MSSSATATLNSVSTITPVNTFQLTYGFTPTDFMGTVVLEENIAGNWVLVRTHENPTASSFVTITFKFTKEFRFRVSAYTSGSVVLSYRY